MPIFPSKQHMVLLSLITYVIASAGAVLSRTENVVDLGAQYQNPKSNPLRKLQSAYPTEYACVNSNYDKLVNVNYSYSIETALYVNDQDITMTSYIEGIIREFEGELLIQLAEELLICGSDSIALARIVGVSSSPSDTPSLERMCTSADNDCTEVDGSLVLFLEPGSDLDEENAITRTLETINNAMTSDYLALRVINLLKASYLGPLIKKPQNSVTEVFRGSPPQNPNPNGSGLTTSGLLVATLVSTMVGFFAAFVLFKKINNRQNCMAACDGSGIDQEFIESQTRPVPVLPLSPNGDRPFDDDEDDGEMQMLHYDLANGGLSAIAETLDMSSSDAESSYASSFAMSAMTNQTNMTRSLADGSNWNDSESISSERTTRTSNRALRAGGRARVLSTPHFGTKDNNLRII